MLAHSKRYHLMETIQLRHSRTFCFRLTQRCGVTGLREISLLPVCNARSLVLRPVGSQCAKPGTRWTEDTMMLFPTNIRVDRRERKAVHGGHCMYS